jgi:hypothetical protein
MAATTAATVTTTTEPSTVPVELTSRTTPLWKVGIIAGIGGALAAELVALAARAVDVPMRAGAIGGDTSEAIPVGSFAFMTLLWTAVGVALAAALGRWARRPARTFVVTTVALTALSFLSPIFAGDTTTATTVALCLTHVAAAAVVVPRLARRLAAARA